MKVLGMKARGRAGELLQAQDSSWGWGAVQGSQIVEMSPSKFCLKIALFLTPRISLEGLGGLFPGCAAEPLEQKKSSHSHNEN